MIETLKRLRRISVDLAGIEEYHEIDGHKVTTEFISHFGFMSACSRHKAYINGKAVGWYEEGPSKSFLEANWSVWFLDSVYFTSKDRNGTGKPHEFRVSEMPYSEPPLYCPIFDNPEEFLKWAIYFKLAK